MPESSKAAPRRTTKATPPPDKAPDKAPLVGFEPIEFNDAPDGETTEQPMVELFRINGHPYHIPLNPSAGLVLQMVADMDEVGEGLATIRLLKAMIGDDAFRDLTVAPGVTKEKITQLATAAMRFTMGGYEEDPAGN